MLRDTFGRQIDYLRLAVTDKCNLRCNYCMPAEGIKWLKRADLLSYEEMLRVVSVLASQGLRKVRITGGEPFLRKDLIHFLDSLTQIPGIEKVNITTNGTLTTKYLDDLWRMGIRSLNLSIDSLDAQRFAEITRRDVFDQVWDCYRTMLDKGFKVKLNMVVMAKQNVQDILPMLRLTEKDPVDVRFIEEMPFNGQEAAAAQVWNYNQILDHIRTEYTAFDALPLPPNSTALNYQVPGHTGSFGVIPAYSRTLCGTCNRLRMTPQGMIKTCLYDEGVFNLRDFLRAGATDEQLLEAIRSAIHHKAKNGFIAEARRKNLPNISESMATIGG